MKLRALRYTLLLVALFGISFLLWASLPSVPTGTWVAAGNLSAARSGACTVALSDGRLLISGGADANGPTATADLFSTTGSWSAAASMNSPRSHQSCAVLQDGRVLVAGGTTSGGGITNAAEMYDPSADSWAQAGIMNDARSGATASVLQDGRVLIAGGQSSGGALNTLEMFDPNSGNFSNAGTMSSPRQDHAAAVLSDGRVLIAGGSSDGTNALNTTAIYDPQAGSVSAGPAMSTARAQHTATTLLDGTVVVIGGSDYTNDLASAEFFDPAANNFNAASSLATARSKHSAFLLPKNNEVLIVGGQSAGTDLNSAELYIPWQKAFQATGAMATPRSDATGAALTKVDGRLLVAGGSDASGNALASTELYAFPTVKTDLADYAPGSIVTITGSGWQPGETVTLTLLESPLIDTPPAMTAVADANGNILNNQFSPDSYDVNVRFYLTAVGQTSAFQAQNTFTDAAGDTTSTAVVCAPSSVTVNTATTCTATVSNSQSGAPNGYPQGAVTFSFNGTGTFSPISGVCTVSQVGSTNDSSCSVTLTPTTAVSGKVKGNFNPPNNNNWKPSVSDNFSLTVTAPTCTAPAVSTPPGNQIITYGADATFAAAASGTPTPTVQWQVNTGSGFTDISGANSATLTVTKPAVSATGNQYRAVFTNTCGGTQTATSSGATLTVNRPTLTVTADNQSRQYGATDPAFTFKIAGFVNGETSAVLTAQPSCSSTATANSPASPPTYPISCTGAAAANYSFSYVDGALTITKIDATIVVTGYNGPYTATAHGATGTATGLLGADLNSLLHVAATTYTDAPGGLVHWTFDGNTNYNSAAGDAAVTITKVDATIAVTGYSGPYTATAHGATGTATGLLAVDLNSLLHVAATTYTNVPGGLVHWTFDGNTNYNSAAGDAPVTITKVDATITVTPYSVAYNGAAHTATGTAKGVLNENLIGLNLSGTTHTNPGDYLTDPWTFTDVTGNYNNANGTVHDRIGYGACSVGAGGVILPPINSDGTSVYNRKGGSTIPVKFNVCGANGAPLTDPTLVFAGTGGALTMTGAMRGTITVVNEDATNDIPDAAFTWDGQQWHFNMATMNLSSGYTYTFRINLAYAPASIQFVVGVK